MNGFANTILSLILGWLRVLIGNIWKLVSSPGGGSFYQFFSDHWGTIVIVLCVGGFVLDRVVYFFRWRPDYVWASRRERRRLKRALRQGDIDEAPLAHDDTNAYSDEQGGSAESAPYAPQNVAQPAPSFAPAQRAAAGVMPPVAPTLRGAAVQTPQGVFAPPVQAGRAAVSPVKPIYNARVETPASPMPTTDVGYQSATSRYAPIARAVPAGAQPAPRAYQPPQNLEPVFDDELPSWEEGATLVKPAMHNPAQGMVNSFGNAMPEPVQYLRDMQAGFAPMLPPERTYLPNDAPTPPKMQVHPGLGSDALRQSIGLRSDGSPMPSREMQQPEPAYPQLAPQTFAPYADKLHDAEHEKGHGSPLAAIAKKARNFVGMDDDINKLTIRDLQPSVDLRKAFHEPVYPQPKDGEGGDA